MDSGPLGEGVLCAIENNLSPCFTELAITENDIREYIGIFHRLKEHTVPSKAKGETPMEITEESPIKIAKWNANITDLIKCLDFWLTIEYCRVFQLVSSDVLGAVNGCYVLKEVIEKTYFTGFITIPKGSGGELGVDNKICIYSLFLFNVMTGRIQNMFTIDTLFRDYRAKFEEFHRTIEENTEFLNGVGDTSNFVTCERAVKLLMKILENGNEGVLGGSPNEKDNNFYATYNTYKIITLYADFIRKNAPFFK